MLRCIPVRVEVFSGRSVPCYTNAVEIEKAVTSCDLLFRGDFIGIVGKKLGEVVFVNLFGQAMGLGVQISD